MANVIITMTVNTATVNQGNLGTTITHSVEGGELVKHNTANSQLDEIKVNAGDSVSFKLIPLDARDTTSICMPTHMNAKASFNLGTIYNGSQDSVGLDRNRTVLTLTSAISGAPGSWINYELKLNIKGVEYTFDPKMTVNIKHP